MANMEETNGAIPAAIRNQDSLEPAEYAQWHSAGTEALHSWNHGVVSVALDSWRKVYGRPAIWSLEQSFAWALDFLAKQAQPEHGHCGHEWRSGIYLRYHSGAIRALRGAAQRAAAGELAAACDRWLRHAGFVSALLAVRGHGMQMTDAQRAGFRGPGVLVTEAPPPRGAMPVSVSDCGLRSIGIELRGGAVVYDLAHTNYSENDLALAIWQGDDDIARALRAAGCDPTLPFSQGERERMVACLDGDVAAALEIAQLLEQTGFPCGYRYHVVRYGADAALSVLEDFYHGSSTAPSYAQLTERVDGDRCRISTLFADSGWRSTRDNPGAVGTGKAALDLAARSVTAQRDDGSLPAATLALPVVEPSIHLVLTPQGIERLIPAPAVPDPDPEPVPQPRPKKRTSWIERMGL